MTIIRCEQGSDEWKALRLGRVTGSRVSDVMAKIKTGEAAGRRNYRAEIICEILTGQTAEGYVSKEMMWGTEQEPFARVAYELAQDVTVEKIGFAVHPALERFGSSPDGLIGEDGLCELKCPNTATHIDYLLRGVVPAEYQLQMLSEMACAERQWADFVSYDPRLPKDLQLFVRRFHRDDARIKEIETMVSIFLSEVDDVLNRLKALSQ
jgi:hypothetical protein